MPAAGAEASEYGLLCGIGVQMIWLGVEACGEGHDGAFIQGNEVAGQMAAGGGGGCQSKALQ